MDCMLVTPVFDGQKTGLAIDGEGRTPCVCSMAAGQARLPGHGMARPANPRRNSRPGRHYPALSLSGL
jgi:hypothetical protein